MKKTIFATLFLACTLISCSKIDEKDPISPWVIAIIIVGALAVIAVAVVLVLKFKKK